MTRNAEDGLKDNLKHLPSTATIQIKKEHLCIQKFSHMHIKDTKEGFKTPSVICVNLVLNSTASCPSSDPLIHFCDSQCNPHIILSLQKVGYLKFLPRSIQL